MTDIFISTISDQLNSWSEAFPASILSSSIQDISIASNDDLVFWIHQNNAMTKQADDQAKRQKWLAALMRVLFERYPSAKVVVLSNAPDQAESIDAIKLGALG